MRTNTTGGAHDRPQEGGASGVTGRHNKSTCAMEANCDACGALVASLADEVPVPNRGRVWLGMLLGGQLNHREHCPGPPRTEAELLAAAEAAPCAMLHQPPMDFAFCETHDDTFPLGGVCRYYRPEVTP